MGYYTTAYSGFETVFGRYNTAYTPLSITDWNANDRLFVIGNGLNSVSKSDAFVVLKNGNVGIGTSSPSYKLTVSGTTWCTSGAWTGSDLRWKKNIIEINNVLSNLLTLKPVTYQWKIDEFPEMNFTNDVQIGLIAQDVEKIFPNLVMTDNNGYKAVSYEKLSVVLLEAIKEQQQEIESYKSENDNLKSRLQSLQEKVDRIEAMLVKGEGN
jgi:hypothetical protein